ncbi:TPA: hypothetical protein DD712_04445 [Candidatus Acetothermia bacterium]|nr:hypothetical protein [Candidatus Acetothermia bacterium]
MGRKFLAVDWQLEHSEFESGSFADAPSFAGYDALFIDPSRICDLWIYDVPCEKDGVRRTYTENDRGFGKVISRLIERRRTEIDDLLRKAGGIVVCRLLPRSEPLEVMSNSGRLERLNRGSILPSISLVKRNQHFVFPSNIRFLPRCGQDVFVEKLHHPFVDYLHTFADKFIYQAVFKDLLSSPIEEFVTILARNKVGDIIALSIPFDEGRLVLIPPTHDVPSRRESEVLLAAIAGATERPLFAPAPDWLPAYPVPGEDGLRDELASLNERVDRLCAKKAEVEKRLDQSLVYKRILYTKGRFSLFSAVRQAFRVLGFEVPQPEEYKDDWDLLLQADEGDAIGVIAATESTPVGLEHYRRLLQQVDGASVESAHRYKGILVVNAEREKDPKRRETQFSPDVLRGCQAQRFCIISTYQLYKIVKEILTDRDETRAAHWRKKILETSGEMKK